MPRVIEVSQAALAERILAATSGVETPAGGRHILVACTPKSGSTYLTNLIAGLPDFDRVTLTFGFGRREQELCPVSCAAYHAINYVAQHHVRYSVPTQTLLTSFQIFPVVLIRNIYDWVVSFRDHICSGEVEASMAYIPPAFADWDQGRQFDFVIDFLTPWYANFLASWADYTGPLVQVLYRDVVFSPHEVIARIAREAGIQVDAQGIDHAIQAAKEEDSRFNVGRMGRGAEQLSRAQISRLQQLLEPYNYVDMVRRVVTL